MNNYPIARELVLVGGGHSHVILLRMLGMEPVPGLKVTLVSPDIRTPYSGMLPGLVAGHYTDDEVYIDLVPLCRFAGVDFIRDQVNGIDVASQTVLTSSRPPLHYDILSMDIGSTPSMGAMPNRQSVIPVKPISGFLSRWQEFLSRYGQGEIDTLGIVGAGAGGLELALAIEHHLKLNFHGNTCRINLISDRKTILNDYPAGVRVHFEKLCNERQIDIQRDFHAINMEGDRLIAADGRDIRLDEVFWVTRAGAQTWPGQSGLATDEEGFIQVGDTLQATQHENIFAVGDCAVMVNHPRPKAGVYAVRQGKPLFENIKRYALGEPLKPYKPQQEFLSLISTGAKHAVASRNGISMAGGWVWRWKNWIDHRFMQRFSDLPVMTDKPANALQAEFDEQMQCGGCGSKVSADMLEEVLKELLGSDAPTEDAAIIEVPEGRTLIQSVDHFRSFLNDPYRQARIAVVHALSDIYACGGTATSVLATLTLPFAKPGATRALLVQLLRGAVDQLREEGVVLAGGHTSEGLELSIGFTANGHIDRATMWHKEGLRPGDALILTKPLGTGTILAADMQYCARGDWVEAALSSMQQSNRTASEIFRQYDVSACTDVTGYGLAGHCLEMISADIGIDLDVRNLPMIEGADACLNELSIMSTLHDSNRSAARGKGVTLEDEILFDPQTSGGLMAGVKAEVAAECVNALVEAGYTDAVIIGKVTDSGRIN